MKYVGSNYGSLTLDCYCSKKDESVQRLISEIANNTISEINQISQLVTSTPSSARPSGSESGPSSRHSQGSLLTEIQRRSPSTSSNRSRSKRVGRPSNETFLSLVYSVKKGLRQNTDPRSYDPLLTLPYWPPLTWLEIIRRNIMIHEDLFTIIKKLFVNRLTFEFQDGGRMVDLLRAIVSTPFSTYVISLFQWTSVQWGNRRVITCFTVYFPQKRNK